MVPDAADVEAVQQGRDSSSHVIRIGECGSACALSTDAGQGRDGPHCGLRSHSLASTKSHKTTAVCGSLTVMCCG